jgi:putative hydrolase
LTNAYINIAKNNELVDVIGHCTTDYFPFDYEKTLKYFKEYNKLVEINESSIVFKKGSRINCYEILKLCKRFEVPIIVNTDCHYCELIGKVPESEKMIADLDFPKELILNRKLDYVLDYINAKRKNDNT